MGPRNPWDDDDGDEMPGMGPGMGDTPMGYGGPMSEPGMEMGMMRPPMMTPPMGGYPGAGGPPQMPQRGNQFVESLRRLTQGAGQGGPPSWMNPGQGSGVAPPSMGIGEQVPGYGQPQIGAGMPQGAGHAMGRRPNPFMQAFRRR